MIELINKYGGDWMNKKFLSQLVIIILLGLSVSVVFSQKVTVSGHSSIARSSKKDNKLTEDNITGTWINHHDTDIKQKIMFLPNHKWHENQYGITDIYHGTWKLIEGNKISLSPYNEVIQLYGNDFQRMRVLSYDHILDKESK